MHSKIRKTLCSVSLIHLIAGTASVWAVQAPRPTRSLETLDAPPGAPTANETPIAVARFRGPIKVGPTSANDRVAAERIMARLLENPRLFKLTRLPTLEIEFVHRTTPRSLGVTPTLFVGLVQKAGDLVVAGSKVIAIVKTMGGEDLVVSLRGTLFPAAEPPSRRALSSFASLSRLSARLPAGIKADRITSRGSRLYWLDGRWQAVQEFSVAENGWRALVDEAGGVRLWDDRRYDRDYSGTVTGDVQLFDPLSASSEQPLANLTVTALPWLSVLTGVRGGFSIPSVPETAPPLQIHLSGPSVVVSNYGGLQETVTVPSGTPNPLAIHFSATDEKNQAQANGFYHTNLVQKWLSARGIAPDYRTPVRVWTNIPDTCNAFYFEGNIHFFASGDGCVNTAFDTVIYHEYGHLIDDAIGGIEDGGLSEGWGDVLAAFVTGQPLIGENFEEGGSPSLRSAVNNYEFNPRDEIHTQGQAWAGFSWDLRESLVGSLGPEAGAALAEDLILPVFWGAPENIPQAVQMVSWIDDDNGNRSDGTPRGAQIRLAADRHGFGDHVNPTLTVAGLTPGSTFDDVFTIRGTASDNVNVSAVSVTVDGEYRTYATETSAWTVLLDPAAYAAGPHVIQIQAVDDNGNEATPVELSVVFSNQVTAATYDPVLKAPACRELGSVCDSGPLLNGRSDLILGAEKYPPTNIGADCPDGSGGTYHYDESLDRLRVTALDGGPLLPGKQVRLDASVWAYDPPYIDYLDLYYTSNALSPTWNYLTTLVPPEAGYQVLSTTFTLGFGSLQAVRGTYGFNPSIPGSCRSAPYDDTDDLAFRTSDPFGFRPTISALSPADGLISGGTTVALTGTNFESGETVLIGGVPAVQVEVVSSTLIRFQTPGGPVGAKDVTVSNPSGQSATFAGGFTYRVGAGQTVNEGRAYPNPFRPDRAIGSLTIGPLPADIEVKIYSMTGELVRELRSSSIGAAEWDARNQSGESVSSGVYLAHVSGAGSSKIIKLVIQR